MSERKLAKNGVTLEEYTKIKAWFQVPGLSNADIERMSGRSWPTIRNIKNSENYDHYHVLSSEASKQHNALRTKIEAKKEETKMSFGERQTELDEQQVVEPVAEKVEEPKKTDQESKYEALFRLEQEILQVRKELLEVEKEISISNKAMKEELTKNLEAMGVNTQAIKDLTDAIKE